MNKSPHARDASLAAEVRSLKDKLAARARDGATAELAAARRLEEATAAANLLVLGLVLGLVDAGRRPSPSPWPRAS